MKRAVQMIGPSAPLADRKASAQRAVNWYLSAVEGQGEDKAAILHAAPGMVSHYAASGLIRGSYNADGRWFAVCGQALLEITTAGTATNRGVILGSGFVSMKHGRDQLVVVTGDLGYTLNLTSGALSQITSDGWRGSEWVEELDGYFIFVDPQTDQFYISGIDNAASLNALDFSSADTAPDNVVTHRVFKRELVLFGTRTTEIWINSGAPDFPLARYNSTPIEVGIVGKRAAVKAADSLFFIGQTEGGARFVYEMQGHQPVRISHKGVEEALALSTDIASASMWTYLEPGHEFVGINAPGMETTWVFDASTRQWHERGAWVDGAWTQFPMDYVTHYGASHYAGHGSTFYRLSADVQTLPVGLMKCERTWPHLIHPSMKPVSYSCLELACSTGNGQTLTLEISNDGGSTFGAPLQKSLGATGQRMKRIRWMGLGSSRDRVFRLSVTPTVPVNLHAAALEAK